MKLRVLLVAFGGLFSVLSAFGLVEELDLYAWQGDSLPGGWSAKKLNKAAEGKDMYGGAYFNSIDGQLQSPVFSAAIRLVTLYVQSSTSDPTRLLYLQPMRDGAPVSDRIPVGPTPAKAYVAQTFELKGSDANQFELNLDGFGSSGNWAMIYVTVHYGRSEPGEDDDGASGCWKVSSFTPRPGIRRADFSPLGGVIPGAAANGWQNGQTVRGFHAFYADNPCTSIRNGGPSSTAGGLYMIVTNDANGSLRALALHGTGDSQACLLLPVALDVERTVDRLCVDYRAWSLGGKNPTDLNFSYRLLDDISDLKGELANEWTDVPDAAWTSSDPDSARTADVPPDCLPGRTYICFRWWVPKRSNSPIMGISDIRVSAALRPNGLMVSIR